MRKALVSGVALVCLAVWVGRWVTRWDVAAAWQRQTRGSSVGLAIVEVGRRFPALPERMLLGGVGRATADSHGSVVDVHAAPTPEDGNATENGYVAGPS